MSLSYLPVNSVADAFDKLRLSISDIDAHEFASTSLEDVWRATRDIQNAQRQRQSAQKLRRIEPLLRGIEVYAKVLEVLCNGTPYMPYIWAPIKLILQIACNHRDIFEALLCAYADIGAALPRFDRYEQVFKDNREFQHVLAQVYCSILEFHEQAYKLLRRRAWTVIFLSLWKDFQSRFKTIIESLKIQRDFVDREAASINIVEAKESRSRLQNEIEWRQKDAKDAIERHEKNEAIARLRHSVEWLSVDDAVQESEYEKLSLRRHDGTCEWIVEVPPMKNWLKNNAAQPFLWLSGKPGAGKSVMCSYIVSVLDQLPDISACYYFCNDLGTGTICSQILRTISLQLLRRHLDLASLIANEYVYRGANCGMVQLRTLILQILEIIPDIRIIIDGLDECSIDDQKAVLNELQSLCIRPTISCKVIFSSRREVNIREKLSRCPQISLEDREEVGNDIRSYVKFKITKLHTNDRILLKRIESRLVEKADGMFLWVRLVIEELQYCGSDVDLEERSMSLPSGLKQAYGRIIDRIMDGRNPKHARSTAIRILEWMSCSYRLLKSYEILDGLAFRTRESSENTDLPGCAVLSSTTKVQQAVLDLCKPLIEDGPGNTIDFVHFSAKEYILEQEHQNARPFVSAELAHFNIAFSCISYLNGSFSLLPADGTEMEQASIIIQGFHGLHPYANRFWIQHVIDCCKICAKRQGTLPVEFLDQLRALLRFRQQASQNAAHSSHLGRENRISRNIGDESGLNLLPRDVRRFLSDLISFRKRPSRIDLVETPIKDIIHQWCTEDPTYFSTISHNYQHTLEELLSSDLVQTFPGMNTNYLKSFREIYEPSAFICRFFHCSRAVTGFDSKRKRGEHESAHQRKYRCAQSSCVSFASGFPTKSKLSRHNEKYHTVPVKDVNFFQGISLALRQIRKSPAVNNLRQANNLRRESQYDPRFSTNNPLPDVSMGRQSLASNSPKDNSLEMRSRPSSSGDNGWAAMDTFKNYESSQLALFEDLTSYSSPAIRGVSIGSPISVPRTTPFTVNGQNPTPFVPSPTPQASRLEKVLRNNERTNLRSLDSLFDTTDQGNGALKGLGEEPGMYLARTLINSAALSTATTLPMKMSRPSSYWDERFSLSRSQPLLINSNQPQDQPQLHQNPQQMPPNMIADSVASKSDVKTLFAVRDHTTDQLVPEGDEYIPREYDEAGEKKVQPTGILNDNREYRCRTFYVPNRGNKLFMLANACALVLGYRDADQLFSQNRSLYKIIASNVDKDSLVDRNILPFSSKAFGSRQVAIITAKSIFRQFGSRVIVNGRRARDDYWETEARYYVYTENDLASEKRPEVALAGNTGIDKAIANVATNQQGQQAQNSEVNKPQADAETSLTEEEMQMVSVLAKELMDNESNSGKRGFGLNVEMGLTPATGQRYPAQNTDFLYYEMMAMSRIMDEKHQRNTQIQHAQMNDKQQTLNISRPSPYETQAPQQLHQMPSNMMAANGIHQNVIQPQQPQNIIDPATEALGHFLLDSIRQQRGFLSGWQANIYIMERFSLVWNLTTFLGSIMASETPDMKQLGIMALRCEQAAFERCLDEESWKKILNRLTTVQESWKIL